MHEMSICEGILQVLEKEAGRQGFQRVKGVWLEIGPLAGVEAEALRFCFDAVVRGSLAEGAQLEIIEIPGQGVCLQCDQSVPVRQRFDPCPACGGYGVRITHGEELRIKELEVE
jgi:hydrogenase nickel incorporation protein HypA/HybF